jgi:hypothetical protein
LATGPIFRASFNTGGYRRLTPVFCRSRFTLWFTLRLQKSPAVQSISDGNHRLVNVRVLVVDDNRTSRRFLHEQIIAWKMRNGKATMHLNACGKGRKKATPIHSPSSTWICRIWTA